MNALRQRGLAYENKFAFDEEFKFKAEARRNKLLGLWAAHRLGNTDAVNYAQDVVHCGLEKAEGDNVFEKVRRDFMAAGVAFADHDIQTKMHDLLVDVFQDMNKA